MTQDQLVTNKKVKSYELTESDIIDLIQTDKSLMITDIIVSAPDDERIEFTMSDGERSVPILFIKEKGVHTINFPTGLLFWKGANLKCKKDSQRITWVTVGYLIYDGDNYEKWKL